MSVIYNYNRPLGLRSKKESKANTVGEIKEEKEMERGEEETGVPFLKGPFHLCIPMSTPHSIRARARPSMPTSAPQRPPTLPFQLFHNACLEEYKLGSKVYSISKDTVYVHTTFLHQPLTFSSSLLCGACNVSMAVPGSVTVT